MEKSKKLKHLNDRVHELIHDCQGMIDKDGEDGRVVFQQLSKLSTKLNELSLKEISNGEA